MKKILPLIIACLTLILLAFGYAFMYRQVADGVQRASVALGQVDTLSERDALVRSQEVFLEHAATELAAVNTYVADDADVVALIETIEDTARREGVSVTISSVDTTDEGGWGFHEGVIIRFSSAGTFGNMARFIAALEALPRASTLQNAALEVSSGGTWFASLSVMFVKVK